MTVIMVFDCETTGLVPKDKITKENESYFPHIVSLSWVVYDTELKETLIEKDKIVTCAIPIMNSFIHHITDEISQRGIPLECALNEFLDDTRDVDLVIAHNLSFDCKMIEVSLYRLGRTRDYTDFKIIKSHCTMMSNIKFCGLKNKYGLKFPRLIELYVKLFGEEFENQHNSLADVKACLKCYLKLNC
jgi:DNA polymerase III epsilon subunit-like protein